MKVEQTGQLGFYRFSKTALPIGRDLTNRAQALNVEGLKGVKGCVLGRYRMTSRLKETDTRRWFLPVIEYLGKLGQPNGPSLAAVLELAEMRKTFLAGLPPMLEASGAALEIEGPPDPPASSLDEPLDGPPEPPPAFYEGLNAGRDDDIDNVDFGP